MSDEKNRTEELDRLRADHQVLIRHGCFVRAKVVENEIKRLEAEADPWRAAKNIVDGIEKGKDCLRPAQVEHARYTRWLERQVESRDEVNGFLVREANEEEAAKTAAEARIAELKEELTEWNVVAADILPNHQGPLPSHVNRRVKELQARIAELEARPVPPLDPKRVIATACKVIRESDTHSREKLMLAGCLMMEFKAGNAGIYPLAGE